MILVAGEALIDMLPDGPGRFRAVPGGSPYNVALALGRLGAATGFLCPMSTDVFGDRLAAGLIEAGVDLSLCPRTASLSTLGFVQFEAGRSAPRYAFYTEGTAGCALGAEDIPRPPAPAVTAVHLGSFSLAVEPCGSALEALADAVGPGRVVSVDPNIRPLLVGDASAYRARLGRLLARADVVKVSEEDLAWLEPGMAAGDCASRWLGRRARLVVVTSGADGAVAFTRGFRVECPAVAVEVADTVGAGDTFQAALLARLAAAGRLSPEGLVGLYPGWVGGLLDFAARAAAITCSRPGCNPPWAAELAG